MMILADKDHSKDEYLGIVRCLKAYFVKIVIKGHLEFLEML